MEGVSFDNGSDNDDSDVVEQSLMQLFADPSSEESHDDENHTDLHVLVLTPGNMLGEDDVVITDAEAPGAQAETCTAPAKNEQSHSSPAASNVSLHETIESWIGSPGFSSDYTALSPSDIALLDGPDPQPANSDIQIPKVEENPFSPSLPKMDVDNKMFPALPSSETPIVPQTTAPLPNGPVKINGVYYQPVPTPHNIVVATSNVSDPTLMALNSQEAEKPKVGLEFAMPEQPPAKKTGRRTRSRSRSSSRNRSKAEFSHEQPTDLPPVTRCGRCRGRPKMSSTPIEVPASHSHLLTKSKPKEGLKITFATDTHERKVESTVQHLAKLSTEASVPLVVTSRPSKETFVKPEPPIEAQEDSDVDLVTGEISIPTLPTESQALIYRVSIN